MNRKTDAVDKLLRASDAAKRLGLKAVSPRALEKHGLVSPIRDWAGHRRYKEDEIERLRKKLHAGDLYERLRTRGQTMPDITLIFKNRKLKNLPFREPVAWASLSFYMRDKKGRVLLTPDCLSHTELAAWVRMMKQELDDVVEQAQKKFAKAEQANGSAKHG